MNAAELESVLRSAPVPPVPAGLRERLGREARAAMSSSWENAAPEKETFLKRAWPLLWIGGGLLAAAATWVVQQGAIEDLRSRFAAGTGSSEVSGPAAKDSAAGAPEAASEGFQGRREEVVQLRTELARLRADEVRIRSLAAENRGLEARLLERSGVAPEDLAAMDAARERAASIRCVNNLKQIGLALRVWATDYADRFPGDFLSMTNELTTPIVLVCPSDPGGTTNSAWALFRESQSSYEYLAPGMSVPNGSDEERNRVAARCRIHQHVLLSDGSVQMMDGTGANPTGHLVSRNGKLYFVP
ncbi:MAG: hypothetical protein JNL10_08330 [Verrucomicrobiales bacterium]|nr:hypothetical protein [Verrucomicrobiales bacterium]